jgi:heme A synthase
LSAFIKKLERSYTTNVTAHLKALEQKEAITLKRSRWQEIIFLNLNPLLSLSANSMVHILLIYSYFMFLSTSWLFINHFKNLLMNTHYDDLGLVFFYIIIILGTLTVLIRVSIPGQNTMTKKQVGEERFYSAYTSILLVIT